MRHGLPIIITFVVLAANAPTSPALEQGDWVLRGGLGYVAPNDDSGSVSQVAGSSVSVDDAFTFAFTAGYMFTNNIGLELLGIWPSAHDVDGEGTLPGLGINTVGDLDVFPPTLSVNYYFMPKSKFRPHLGIGLNYTTYFDTDVTSQTQAVLGANTGLDIDDSIGVAFNVGADFDITENTFLTLNVWYVDIEADATLTGTALGNLNVDIDVDPWVVLVGAGIRF